MKTQTLALLWLVAVCVTWTVPLCETAEPSEINDVIAEENSAAVERSDEDTHNLPYPIQVDQIVHEETAEPSENGGVETDLSSFAEENSEENSEMEKSALPEQEDLLNDQNDPELAGEVEAEHRRFSRVSRDCKDLRRRGYRRNGVYVIRPDRGGHAFKVYCDMTTDGGGWTVIQRRKDGSENFYRPWNKYVQGFGKLRGEFFLGLKKIHQLTKKCNNAELRVAVNDFQGSKGYAKYSSFAVGDSASKYVLTVSGYSGNAGDSLSYHNGMKFSTYDRDNDLWSGNCAQIYKGAWWYNVCHHSNLNGAYLGTASNGGTITTFADGVIWYHFKNSYYYSLKGDVMMVRRK